MKAVCSMSNGVGEDVWKRWILSFEWKRVEVDGDSSDDGVGEPG